MKWCFLFLILIPINLKAQQYLRWQPSWYGKPIIITEEPSSNDTFHLTQLKWYMSGLTCWKHGKKAWEDSAEVRLWEAGNLERMQLKLPNFADSPDSISFYLGLDSLSHLQVLLTGDTDPTLGMYWTWQNGYIHLKMEGNCSEIGKPNRKLSLHLGGYRHTPTRFKIGFRLPNNKKDIQLFTELSHWIHAVQSYPDQFMQPGPQAVQFTAIWAQYFFLKP